MIAFITLLFICQGCNENVNSLVKKLIGSTLSFDWSKQTLTADSIYDGTAFHAPVKIVLSVDSTLCEPCLKKYLNACGQYMEYLDNDSVMLICIIQPSQVRGIQDSLKWMNISRVTVVLDTQNDYRRKNSIEKYNRMYTSFLLDRNNRIVLVGDPLRSNEVRELYEKQIKMLVNNNGGILY